MHETYKRRNGVDPAFAKAKQLRRFAARHEKLKEVDLGVARLVFGFIHVRKLAESDNTVRHRRSASILSFSWRDGHSQ